VAAGSKLDQDQSPSTGEDSNRHLRDEGAGCGLKEPSRGAKGREQTYV
jgi:hypothetical protein